MGFAAGRSARLGTGLITLVATPIGNLGDVSERARSALAQADVIAAEDTRKARVLLSHLGIPTASGRLVSYHRSNERESGPALIEAAQAGGHVVLVSDAGMPGVSDPGEALVRRAVAAGIEVTCVPGPSAVLVALVLSGLRTDRFAFDGFPPRRGSGRREWLEEVASERRTVVAFEAPHRVVALLTDLARACGADRLVAVTRELTKLFETVWRGTLGEAAAAIGEPRGEYVIVIAGAELAPTVPPEDLLGEIDALLDQGLSLRDATTQVAEAHRRPKNALYRAALSRSRQTVD